MNLEREVAFAFLEEDKVHSAYFRVVPLLTREGDIREAAKKAWPEDGALRIIPDRNEQFTFKDRMRDLGSWCAVDMTAFPPDANKIRTNKNYRPERGEHNQYILFSDCVFGPERAPFRELLEGKAADAVALSKKAITPVFYIRDGDTVYGPVSRVDSAAPQVSGPLDARVFRVTLPDGREHAMLCTEEAPEAESLPIGESLEILDKTKTFEETVEALSQPLSDEANLINSHASPIHAAMQESDQTRKLTGTPLIRTNIRTSTPMVKNRVQEVVNGQFLAARNAEPPAPPVPFNSGLPQVENPVARAEDVLQRVWSDSEVRARLAQFLLSMEGMKQALDESQKDSNSRLATAMQKHLEELEIERLRLLIEIDQAKSDLVAFRAKAVSEATGKARREIESLTRERDRLKEEVAALRAAGGKASVERHAYQVLESVEKTFTAAGLPFSRENACAWLAVVARPGRIGVVSTDPEGCIQMCENHAHLLGWPFGTLIAQEKDGWHPQQTDTPRLCLTFDPHKVSSGEIRLLCIAPEEGAFIGEPIPVIPVNFARYHIPVTPIDEPITLDDIRHILEHVPVPPEEIRTILRPAFEAAELSEEVLGAAADFAATAAGLMDGGLVAACDWAMCLYLAPRITAANRAAIAGMLADYPRCLALMNTRTQPPKADRD